MCEVLGAGNSKSLEHAVHPIDHGAHVYIVLSVLTGILLCTVRYRTKTVPVQYRSVWYTSASMEPSLPYPRESAMF